jgi:hypothetical protein
MRLWTLHPTYLDAKGLVALGGRRCLGQLGYEWKQLRAKLAIRDKAWLASLGVWLGPMRIRRSESSRAM